MRVSAKVDYALRAMLELTGAEGLVKAERIATAQAIPQKFLEGILLELRRAELAEEINVADVIRAVEGPIATVRGMRPDELQYPGAAQGLAQVWLDLRTAMRDVLEGTSLAQIAASATPKTERKPAA